MEYRHGALCPSCEVGVLGKTQAERRFSYKTKETTIQCVSYQCGQCGEFFVAPKERRHIERVLTDVRRRVDGLLTSDEIREVRKRFGRTQTGFAKILGVGDKNFARYESGQTAQSRTMDNLLRALKAYPEIFGIFETQAGEAPKREVYTEEVIRRPRRWKAPVSYQVGGEDLNFEEGYANASSF
jgi:HTH-type transcriptional regulator/antitoxin MqsA